MSRGSFGVSELDAVRRAAHEDKAAALQEAQHASMVELDRVRREALHDKTTALEEAHAELLAAVGLLLQEAQASETNMQRQKDEAIQREARAAAAALAAAHEREKMAAQKVAALTAEQAAWRGVQTTRP